MPRRTVNVTPCTARSPPLYVLARSRIDSGGASAAGGACGRRRRARSRATSHASSTSPTTTAMPTAGPTGTVLAVTASPGTTGTASAGPASAIRQTAGSGSPAKPWSVVLTETTSRLPASIGATTPGSATVRRAVPSAGHRDPDRGDGAAEQGPQPVRGELVELGEQHRLGRRGLARHPPDRDLDPGRAGDQQRSRQGSAAELRRLPRQLRGERREPGTEVAQRAADPGQRRDRGGVAARRVAGPPGVRRRGEATRSPPGRRRAGRGRRRRRPCGWSGCRRRCGRRSPPRR